MTGSRRTTRIAYVAPPPNARAVPLSRPQLLFSLGLLLTILALAAETADPLLLVPLVLLMALLVTLAPLPYLAFGPRFRWLTRWSLLALAVTAGSLPLDWTIWRRQTDATHRRRAQVVAALEAYRQQHSRYPDSLAQLVPRYLPGPATTARGLLHPRPFFYQSHRAPTGGYFLSYDALAQGQSPSTDFGIWHSAD